MFGLFLEDCVLMLLNVIQLRQECATLRTLDVHSLVMLFFFFFFVTLTD